MEFPYCQVSPYNFLYNFSMEFTKRFNLILKSSGKSQVELAKYCNISRQSITDYKKGRTYPSYDILCLICKFFDVSADYLLGLSDY